MPNTAREAQCALNLAEKLAPLLVGVGVPRVSPARGTGKGFLDEYDEMEEKYNIFIDKLGTYQPRKYIEDNLNVEKCSTNFLQLL